MLVEISQADGAKLYIEADSVKIGPSGDVTVSGADGHWNAPAGAEGNSVKIHAPSGTSFDVYPGEEPPPEAQPKDKSSQK